MPSWLRPSQPLAPPALPSPVVSGAIDQPIPPAANFDGAVNAPELVTLYKAGQPVQVSPEAVADLLAVGYERAPVDLAALAQQYRVQAQAAIEATAAYYADATATGVLRREADSARAAAEIANAQLADTWLHLHYWTMQRYAPPKDAPEGGAS